MNTLNGSPIRIALVPAVPIAGAAVYDMCRIDESGAKASCDGKVGFAPYHAG